MVHGKNQSTPSRPLPLTFQLGITKTISYIALKKICLTKNVVHLSYVT
jgi:hypothetical protein